MSLYKKIQQFQHQIILLLQILKNQTLLTLVGHKHVKVAQKTILIMQKNIIVNFGG
jgi:hypothetical protein